MGQQSSLCYNSAEITMHGLREKERTTSEHGRGFSICKRACTKFVCCTAP